MPEVALVLAATALVVSLVAFATAAYAVLRGMPARRVRTFEWSWSPTNVDDLSRRAAKRTEAGGRPR